MKKLRFCFVTEWRFNAPAADLWAIIDDAEAIAKSWNGVKRFQILDAGRPFGPGSRIAVRIQRFPAKFDFVLTVTEALPPRRLGLICRGELEGGGLWQIEDESDGVIVSRFRWEVWTTTWRMYLLGLLLRPELKRGHAHVMAQGFRVINHWLERRARPG